MSQPLCQRCGVVHRRVPVKHMHPGQVAALAVEARRRWHIIQAGEAARLAQVREELTAE